MHVTDFVLVALAVCNSAAHTIRSTSPRLHSRPKPNSNDTAGGNIIGGQVAEPGSTPWLASIQATNIDEPVHFCGATILSHFWLLTAASCVSPYWPEEIQVVVGEYDFNIDEGYEKVKRVIAIIVHPDYDAFEQPAFDVALLLISPFYYNDWISPIALPPPFKGVLPWLPESTNSRYLSSCRCNHAQENNLEGWEGQIAGWGEKEDGMRSSIVMKASVTILNDEDCQSAYPTHNMESLMCAANITTGGVDACVGDSGGGLVSNEGYLLGIYTYERPCGDSHFPGLYVNISVVQSWICGITHNYNYALAWEDNHGIEFRREDFNMEFNHDESACG